MSHTRRLKQFLHARISNYSANNNGDLNSFLFSIIIVIIIIVCVHMFVFVYVNELLAEGEFIYSLVSLFICFELGLTFILVEASNFANTFLTRDFSFKNQNKATRIRTRNY